MADLNMLRQDICCSQPPADPNYTVCFPAQQVIPGGLIRANPFYDVTNEQSFWTYTIQIDQAPGPGFTDLSHWVLQVCPELTEDDFVVEVSENGGAFQVIPPDEIEVLAVDPPTGVTNVLKIDRGQPKGTTFTYRITITDSAFYNLAAEPGTVAIKHGNLPAPGFQIFDGASCGSNVLLTPSVECNLQENVALSLIKTCPELPPGVTRFNIGDTVQITLEVTNSGTVPAADVTVLDLINVPAGVTISSLSISDEGTANPPPPPTGYTNTDITVTWSALAIPDDTTVTLTVGFTILAVPEGGAVITNADAGIGELSGTDTFLCLIPVGRPTLSKACPELPSRCSFFIVGDTVTITLAVDNTGGTGTAVTVIDVFNVPAGVVVSDVTTTPLATSVDPPAGPYSDTSITVTWSDAPVAANSIQVFRITFTILAAPDIGAEITNIDAGIGELSGTSQFRCIIPINRPPVPAQFRRGIPLTAFRV